MGTNYYAHEEICPHCHSVKETHIGKSSGGWAFSLHVTDDLPDWPSWQAYLQGPGIKIQNEYGEDVPFEELEMIITQRLPWHLDLGTRQEEDGHSKYDPDIGLFRHPGGVVPGETYDLVEGEFS